MCGFTCFFPTTAQESRDHFLMSRSLDLISHRGPDDSNHFSLPSQNFYCSHVRLSIIDIVNGTQPFTEPSGRYTIVFNGEIYNYRELISNFDLPVSTNSDVDALLAGYIKLGPDILLHLRGMFAFIIWDSHTCKAFIARDRFGIKPLYFHQSDLGLAFSSEIKGLLPFLSSRKLSSTGLSQYFNLQYTLSPSTFFEGVFEFQKAHFSSVSESKLLPLQEYWRPNFNIDFLHSERWFVQSLQELLENSVSLHCTSDVPIASYISGGIDSSLIAGLASQLPSCDVDKAYVGRYVTHDGFDESEYALEASKSFGIPLEIVDISPEEFIKDLPSLIWHLDQPTAGPGSFGQFVLSRHVSQSFKVILGGQGGDELFGGYARYLIAYFEQCIKAAIDDRLDSGKFIVTYESIIPNLVTLESYKPLLKDFFSSGLFSSLNKRYLSLVDRSISLSGFVDNEAIDRDGFVQTFDEIFFLDGYSHHSYFDRMTHFDFHTLLPALLHLEDRVSMAHGLESRIPFLDNNLADFTMSIPSDIKFRDGKLKRLLPLAFPHILPQKLIDRKDKMGFPIPLNQWIAENDHVKSFVADTFSSSSARQRSYLSRPIDVDSLLNSSSKFSRAIWGLLSLELWHQAFID